MKNLTIGLIVFLFVLQVSPLLAQDEKCENEAIQIPASALLKTMKAVSEGLYKDVSKLKVNHDGEGKLSVFYEKGEPKLFKLTYTNSKGTVIIQKSFEELEKGNALVYQNTDKPGKAIVLEKDQSFKNGDKFNFKLSIRTSVDPEKHKSFPVVFNSDVKSPKISSNQKSINNIVISPGISMFKWDGTFTKVEFK